MRLHKFFFATVLFALPWPLGQAQAQQTFRVATYNVENYILEPIQNRPLKKPQAQEKIVESILTTNPDVIALQEMGKKTALIKLQAALKAKGLDLPHAEHLSAFDPAIHVAYLSRFPFKRIMRHDNESYLLNGRRLHVSRGFAEVEFALGRYSFSLITAHLKSKREVAVADEAEMRLQEALRLRRIVDAKLKANPEVNFAVLGDFNDYYNSKPVKALVGRGKSQLIDVRPGERNGDTGLNLINTKWFPRNVSWTHFYGVEDVYSRIDFILLSPSMAKELDRANSWIPVVGNWGHGSDHRPVVATFLAEDK
ncbi:MAG TPA: endonuclease/exonuclease/phosphatase family protein [Verrucomicrobiota bacterium]|nr:endonuclease/exonuclease/phosphatase family protein [Verrucomicrobiota bacterium]